VSVCAAILAGGRGSRIGGRKALVDLDGQPLIAHVARTLLLGTDRLAVIADQEAAARLGVAAIPDPVGFSPGPMVGVLAALGWAGTAGSDWVVLAPCDTPNLPDTYVTQLLAAVQSTSAPVACLWGDGGPEPLLSIWRPDLYQDLCDLLAQERHPPARAIMTRLGAARVDVSDPSSLRNVNTRADLQF